MSNVACFTVCLILGFSGGSDGIESACSEGYLGSVPGSGRSPGEGLGYPLQYSWASLMAHTIKNRLQYRRPGFNPLGWEDPLEEGMSTHVSILACRTPWTDVPGGVQSMGLQRVRHD